MARLNRVRQDDSDDEFPDLSKVLYRGSADVKRPSRGVGKEHDDTADSGAIDKEGAMMELLNSDILSTLKNTTRPSRAGKQLRKQRPLGPLQRTHDKSLLLPISSSSLSSTNTSNNGRSTFQGAATIRSSPKRTVKAPINYARFAAPLTDGEESTSVEDETDTDLSGFIVSDPSSEKKRVSRVQIRVERSWPPGTFARHDRLNVEETATDSSRRQQGSVVIDLTSPKKNQSSVAQSEPQPQETSPRNAREKALTLSDLDEPFATLKFSPPRSRSPHKHHEDPRPVTPPSSPSKSELQSPSKKHRIPPTPHRPSIDAFWSQEVINDWNDQYSPRKTPNPTHRKDLAFVEEKEEDHQSPCASPRKSLSKSLVNRDRAVIARRKAFDAKKHELATSFLAEVDQTIANSQVSRLAESTDGIRIVWSKKLSSTAGRANWRREAIRHKASDGTVSVTTYRHHASIELAEKVIDDEHRLVNVIAHEYCHLANFMISGIKDRPHGKEFKQWAAKCTRAFADRGVEVTTKHNYIISYKYIWACTNAECGLEYKRHSKSIDPLKHFCGKCKGKLVQIQPVARAQVGGKAGRSEYQEFVKREFERVKRENPEKGWGELMAALGKEFREAKKRKLQAEGTKSVEEPVVVFGGKEDDLCDCRLDHVLRELQGMDLRK
ncbi:MAG: hypothetical protein Q9217_001027 [Psora testacea]